NGLVTRLASWQAIVYADAGPLVRKNRAATISGTRRATREMPVAIEKIAVLRATPPLVGGGGGADSSPKASALAVKAAIVRRSAARAGTFGRAAAQPWPTSIRRRSGS